MALPSLDRAARSVLDRYDPVPLPGRRLIFLGNAGGFSGARLWRVEGTAGRYCLRAWPPSFPPERLGAIHRLMSAAQGRGLSFVPAVLAATYQNTWHEYSGRLWDLTTWQPGRADFHQRPGRARLEAACTALARLHLAWADTAPGHGPCPAVRRRLHLLRDWLALVESGWRPAFSSVGAEPLHHWAERAWRQLARHVQRLPAQLAPWADRPMPLQPCLCDIWHDHVLFEGDAVTGVIDFGSIKRDHVAVDLARLLGSLVGDDATQQAAGLGAYARHRPLTEEECFLARVLDQTGTVLGAANWLLWLYREGKGFDDLDAVADRLAEIVRRLEGWPG